LQKRKAFLHPQWQRDGRSMGGIRKSRRDGAGPAKLPMLIVEARAQQRDQPAKKNGNNCQRPERVAQRNYPTHKTKPPSRTRAENKLRCRIGSPALISDYFVTLSLNVEKIQ
jgi:hypothetical protein